MERKFSKGIEELENRLECYERLLEEASSGRRIKKCLNCGQFFSARKGNEKYCGECHSPKIMGRIRYRQRRKEDCRE